MRVDIYSVTVPTRLINQRCRTSIGSKMSEKKHVVYVNSKKKWTEYEKRAFLTYLKKYGSDNVNAIKMFLPNKSKKAIEQMIRKYQAIAELGKKEINSPLDIWLRSGIFDAEKTLIPEALLFISLFEDHPPPHETGGFDLRQAYKFLYEATSGHSNKSNISRKTAEMFKDLILTVDKEVCSGNESVTTDYLISKLCSVEADKSYKSKQTE